MVGSGSVKEQTGQPLHTIINSLQVIKLFIQSLLPPLTKTLLANYFKECHITNGNSFTELFYRPVYINFA